MFIARKAFFRFNVFLPVFYVPVLGLALLGTDALAQDAAATSARLDRIEVQFDAAQSKLQVAQGYGYGRPPGNIGDEDGTYNTPPRQQDAAGLDVRVGHLEEQMRQMNGQIEQIQNAQHKLEEQLKKFQQDVDFRFQDSHGAARPQKRTEAPESDISAPSNPTSTANAGMDSSSTAVPLHGSHRGDAFDPSAEPNAPGAPHQLGSIASTATALPPPATSPDSSRSATSHPSTVMLDDDADPNAPLDLSSGKRGTSPSTPANATPGFGTAAAPRQIPLTPTPQSPKPESTQTAGIPPIASPKDEFDAALGFFKQKEYENAERGFSTFLQKNPKNRMAADATYYLGETYFQRGRQREAAEQYLKISTNYSTSAHAPEAMLRLGQSLEALGAKEQACATFGEVPRKYPNAAAYVKTNAEKEAQRAKC